MTTIYTSEAAGDHSAVSQKTPNAGGDLEASARGRQTVLENEISNLSKAIIALTEAVTDLQFEIEYNTGVSLDSLTDRVEKLQSSIEAKSRN